MFVNGLKTVRRSVRKQHRNEVTSNFCRNLNWMHHTHTYYVHFLAKEQKMERSENSFISQSL